MTIDVERRDKVRTAAYRVIAHLENLDEERSSFLSDDLYAAIDALSTLLDETVSGEPVTKAGASLLRDWGRRNPRARETLRAAIRNIEIEPQGARIRHTLHLAQIDMVRDPESRWLDDGRGGSEAFIPAHVVIRVINEIGAALAPKEADHE